MVCFGISLSACKLARADRASTNRKEGNSVSANSQTSLVLAGTQRYTSISSLYTIIEKCNCVEINVLIRFHLHLCSADTAVKRIYTGYVISKHICTGHLMAEHRLE